MRISTPILAALFVMSATASAQVAPGVYVGARIRSSEGSGWRGTGTVLQSGSDSLVVTSDATGDPVVLRRANVGRLEIGDGERRSTLKGFSIGTLIGVGTGAILGLTSGDQKCTAQQQAGVYPCPSNPKTAPEVAVAGGIFLGILGAGVGTLTGFLRTSDRWVAVGANRVAVSPIVGGDGRLGVSLRY